MNKRLFVIFCLGFSSGLPFSMVTTTLQSWLSVNNIDILTIGMVGLIGAPYVYKFLWASFIDRFDLNFLTRRRDWILVTQLGLMVLLFITPYYVPTVNLSALIYLSIITATLSATQDIAIDAYRSDILSPKERGIGSALAVLGYRVAMLSSGGIALVVAQYKGWLFSYHLMSCCMLVGIIATIYAPILPKYTREHKKLHISLIEPFSDLFKRSNIWQFLLLIFMYKLAESFTSTSSSMTMPFLLQGIGFDLATVGWLNKVAGVIATFVGGILAGFCMLRISLFSSLITFGVLQAASNILFILLSIAGKSKIMLFVAVLGDNLSAGMGMTALLALIISLCNMGFSGTQFALLSAVASLPRLLAGPLGGFMVTHIGWTALYCVAFILALPSILIVYNLKDQIFNLNISSDLSENKGVVKHFWKKITQKGA